ncbi:histamine H2 receptor-like [Patiria miniata]|uniref:G-protein coupled receptors family 1 profile domain-containing protein n=1 Tax=Patiria miniata TaxID=46514 RepID=A0A914AM65_PATMI|nr:histamine H2 receptor-like [Patiria miniata]
MDVLGIISIPIGIVGVIGNSIVCVVIWHDANLRTLTNAFIVNQAVADLLCSLVLPLQFNIPSPDPLPEGSYGEFICKVWTFEYILWLFLNTSTLGLAALTLERYLAIVFPFRYIAITGTKCLPVTLIAVTWLLSVASATLTLSTVEFSAAHNHCDVSPDLELRNPPLHALLIVDSVVLFFLPAILMLFAYVHIMLVLRRKARSIQPMPSITHQHSSSNDPEVQPQEMQNASMLRASKNVIKTLLLVFGVYIICWLPNLIAFVVQFSDQVYQLTIVLGAANSCANPIIYALKYKSFQAGLKKLFRRSH